MHALFNFKDVHEIATLSCFFWVNPKEKKNENKYTYIIDWEVSEHIKII